MATAMPALLPKPAASEAAPAIASMPEASTARTATLPAWMPSVAAVSPSPSTYALISLLILFSP